MLFTSPGIENYISGVVGASLHRARQLPFCLPRRACWLAFTPASACWHDWDGPTCGQRGRAAVGPPALLPFPHAAHTPTFWPSTPTPRYFTATKQANSSFCFYRKEFISVPTTALSALPCRSCMRRRCTKTPRTARPLSRCCRARTSSRGSRCAAGAVAVLCCAGCCSAASCGGRAGESVGGASGAPACRWCRCSRRQPGYPCRAWRWPWPWQSARPHTAGGRAGDAGRRAMVWVGSAPDLAEG